MEELLCKKWNISQGDIQIQEKLKRELHTDDIIARLLYNRDIRTVEEGRSFLYANITHLNDPFIMKDMDKAVERIIKAIDNDERIMIYGDYDVDGITSTSLLERALRCLGANVDYYIPERKKEGYGLNINAVREFIANGIDLVITVDCGISSADLIAEVEGEIDFIVTDHHTPPEVVPKAIAVLNPKQIDCQYPDENLAGVGVAFKLCQGIWQKVRGTVYLEDLDIVALGTVADLVPLVGENRIFVREGIKKINESPNLGIESLMRAAGIEGKKITAGHIGFTIAPRLNAAGRVTHAGEGVKLLTAQFPDKAQEIADVLNETNAMRQDIERNILKVAREQVIEQGPDADKVIVVAGEGWHQGVVGIVASRLVEEFYKPTLVISISDGVGKGSCRSIKAFNMYDALHSVEDILIQYGGHKQAAGFSIKEENIPLLKQRLDEYCDEKLTAQNYIPLVNIDLDITDENIDIEKVEELELLEPYGMGNPTPVFSIKDASINRIMCMGKTKQHIKFTINVNDQELDAISWFGADYQKYFYPETDIKLAFTMGINEWNGNKKVQLTIQDIQENNRVNVHLTAEMLRHMYVKIKRIFQRGMVPEHKVIEYVVDTCEKQFNPKQYILALEVFKELGIIEVVPQDGDAKLYRWCQINNKLELETSITFLTYSS